MITNYGCRTSSTALNAVRIFPTLESAVASNSNVRIDEIVQADLDIAPDEAMRRAAATPPAGWVITRLPTRAPRR